MAYKFPRLAKILADGGYRGTLGDWVCKIFGWVLEVVLSQFPVLPKRWIVERSFSWLEIFRRLTIDYEYLAETGEAMVQQAFVQIMLNKLIQRFQNKFLIKMKQTNFIYESPKLEIKSVVIDSPILTVSSNGTEPFGVEEL